MLKILHAIKKQTPPVANREVGIKLQEQEDAFETLFFKKLDDDRVPISIFHIVNSRSKDFLS